MKDPLRYYLAEGLLGLWCYPNPDKFGEFLGLYHGTYYLVDHVSSEYINGKLHFAAKTPAGEKVMYKVTSDFYLDYATVCRDAEDAEARSKEFGEENEEFTEAFRDMMYELNHSKTP